jgi:hypothetical protein
VLLVSIAFEKLFCDESISFPKDAFEALAILQHHLTAGRTGRRKDHGQEDLPDSFDFIE